MNEKKPRTEHLYGVTNGVVSRLELTVDTGTGEVSLGPTVMNTYSEVSYERAKGPKVLSRVPQPTEFLTFSTDAAMAKNYDFICAVDTNTREIGRKTLSVTGIVTVTNSRAPDPEDTRGFWKFDVPFALVVSQPKASAEHLGWLGAAQYLHVNGYIRAGMRVGVIVDSDLGTISAFNQRKKPVIGPFYLPEGVQLIYATSDAGKESVVNKALATADSIASQTFHAIETILAPFSPRPTNSPWFEGFDMIFPRKKILTPV